MNDHYSSGAATSKSGKVVILTHSAESEPFEG